MCAIFKDNPVLCNEIGGGGGDKVVQHFIHCIESQGKRVEYLEFFQTIVGCCSPGSGSVSGTGVDESVQEPENYYYGNGSIKHRPGAAAAAAAAIQKQQFIRKSQDMVMQEVCFNNRIKIIAYCYIIYMFLYYYNLTNTNIFK